jgi:hypothetical protein
VNFQCGYYFSDVTTPAPELVQIPVPAFARQARSASNLATDL